MAAGLREERPLVCKVYKRLSFPSFMRFASVPVSSTEAKRMEKGPAPADAKRQNASASNPITGPLPAMIRANSAPVSGSTLVM